MAKQVRYVRDKAGDFKPHSDGSLPFAEFVVSSQIRRPLTLAAHDIIAIAKADPKAQPSEDERDGHYIDHFNVTGQKAVLMATKTDPKPRLRAVAVVENDAKNSVPMEFGSGESSAGKSKGKARPQGGWNKPKRILGRAASKVGDFHE
jgi:hypothetical protein